MARGSHLFCFVYHRCVCISFQCSVDNRDLHSFPTRRSSDLARRQSQSTETEIDSCLGSLCNHGRPFFATLKRSEEHTSELQSRGQLVCRLLLEKKKNQRNQKIS